MRNITIIGGTGFLGKSLAEFLVDRGYEVRVVARTRPGKWNDAILFFKWDGYSHGAWHDSLRNTDIVINLAGRSVDCIKTPDHCDEILRSRVLTTRLIGEALDILNTKPELWIQMSTAHIYGDPSHIHCDENAPTGYGLAPTVGIAWEKAFYDAKPAATRDIVLRTGFVLGRSGGAYVSLKRIVKMGLGGTVGSGIQGMSWIHQDDLNEIILWTIQNETARGIYNITAPRPVSNKIFMKSFRNVLKVPVGLPAPEWITRFGAHYIFKTDPELALYGRYVLPKRLQKEGYIFKYTDHEIALQSLQ